ncbi:serine threonine-protein phosphatase 2a catalytic subunit beta isoform, partial [Nannochloropsis oceanica]
FLLSLFRLTIDPAQALQHSLLFQRPQPLALPPSLPPHPGMAIGLAMMPAIRPCPSKRRARGDQTDA